MFLITFAAVLRLYNSDLFMRRMHAKIGKMEMRFAITWGNVYAYRGNYYGAAIINNARLLARDRLNRLLVDNNVYDWFLDRLVGIENLMVVGLEDMTNIHEFAHYDPSKMYDGNNALIHSKPSEAQDREGIKAVDVQKVGAIRQKNSTLDVYNLHLQAVIVYQNFGGVKKTISISVGNLNLSGIDEKGI